MSRSRKQEGTITVTISTAIIGAGFAGIGAAIQVLKR